MSNAPATTALEARVRAWIADDPDPAARAELTDLLDRGRTAELAERFAGELRFGTAGLRGRLGAGPSRINRATVRRASAGLARYLLDSFPDARDAGVVVGYDARHGSPDLAREAARVIAGAGLCARLMPRATPTPVLAFAVRALSCAAGVMITASHNPAPDNGYKVYAADGAQIVPPGDAEIMAAIDVVDGIAELPLAEPAALDDAIVERYLAAVVPAATGVAPAARELGTVYTPLHGVGRDVLLAAFRRAGFPDPHVVAAQGDPDPDFPTTSRPNPEEEGVLDLALDDARRLGADLVLATDPDADRLAVAIPWPDAPSGWRVLGGDEIGGLLADALISALPDPGRRLLVTTVVSSSLLSRLADAAGACYAETLTGFKWIMHAHDGHPDTQFMFGYEQALGFAVTDVVRDKDGISAALVMAAIASEAKARGTTVGARLDSLAERFGLHATAERSIELSGPDARERLVRTLADLRAAPPVELIGRPVSTVDDLGDGVRRHRDGREEPLHLPRAEVLILRSEDRLRLAVRPSGTEPKLKIYLEAVVAVTPRGVGAARREARETLDALERQALALVA